MDSSTNQATNQVLMPKQTEDCSVCYEPYTGSIRKSISCPFCQFSSCLKCVRRYMLESPEDAHCMSCRRAWNRDFIDSYLSRAFRIGDLKKHRENILLDREQARLPMLQPRVEAKVKATEVGKDISVENAKINELQVRIDKLRNHQLVLYRRKDRLERIASGTLDPEQENNDTSEKREVRQFTQKCPVNDCVGFLSTQWKCGTCQTWICPDCLVPKGKEKECEHTCDEDMKATAALIKKDTKPCPKCGMGISKVDGCFAKDTPILLWNGSYKNSQDICVGDILVGDDGLSRTVTQLCSGGDEMFEIIQGKGFSYTVNSKHKLALKFSGEKTIHWSESEQCWTLRWFDRSEHIIKTKKSFVSDLGSKENALETLQEFSKSLEFDEVIELTIDDYMKLTESSKKHLMGFKSSGVQWSTTKVPIDPYLMGLWLGDGINDGMSFAVNSEADPEILTYLLDWCEQNNAEIVHDETYRFRIRRRESATTRLAIGRGASSVDCKGCIHKECSLCDLPNTPYKDTIELDSNHPLKKHLDIYTLTRNSKYIPNEYLVNDRQSRLQLLAGLIDTDGYVGNDGKRIQISQANHTLGRQIEFLARSLGFVVNIDFLQKKNIQFPGSVSKDYNDHIRISISGEHLSEIPTKVSRKKCVDSKSTKDELRTNIFVKSVGQGKYYGWSVTGNKRFLLGDFTVARNCDQMWCVSCKTPFSWTTGRLVFGVVHNPHYYQFMRENNNAVRVVGDVPCGGLVGFYNLSRVIPKRFRNEIEQIHRTTAELLEGHLRNLPRLDEVPDHGDLGVLYSLKEISKEKWKDELWKRETKREKGLDLRGPIDLFANVCTEVLRRMSSGIPDEEFDTLMDQLRQLRIYVNSELEKIGKRYGCMVPAITNIWVFDAHGGNRKTDDRYQREHTFWYGPEVEKKLSPTAVHDIVTLISTNIIYIIQHEKETNKSLLCYDDSFKRNLGTTILTSLKEAMTQSLVLYPENKKDTQTTSLVNAVISTNTSV